MGMSRKNRARIKEGSPVQKNSPPTTSRLIIDLPLILLLFALAVFARALPTPRTIDDAFITFRYSRNIVEGRGFVYNPDVRVMGTTTPLYTLIMAGISTVTRGQDFPWYALTVNALADGVNAVLLYLIARRVTGRREVGILLGALWAIAPQSVTFAIGGMETSTVILWMLSATYAYLQGRTTWMGIFAALGILTRIDSGIWVALLFSWQFLESLRNRNGLPIRTWAAAAMILIPWLAFSTAYFGSPLPRSISAKSTAYIVPPASALVRFIQIYATPFFEQMTFGGTGAQVGSVVYFALSLLGMVYTARRVPRLLPLLVYPWMYALIFSIANPLMFRWYVAPPLPGLMLGIVIGAWAVIEGGARLIPRLAPILAPMAVVGLALLWGTTSIRAWVLQPDHGSNRPAPEMAWHKIELLYQEVGTWLRESRGVLPETRVASGDIGAIGYFSRATIIDTVGLVTPEMSRYYPFDPALLVEGQNYAIPPQLILDYDPDYFVTMESFVRNGLEQNAEFKAEYGDPIRVIPTNFYGTDMRVYRRGEQ
jgi:hypothetical protein